MKTAVPIAIAFLAGLAMVVSFFSHPEHSLVGKIEPNMLSWVTIIGGFTLLLGVVSIVRVNYTVVRRRGDGWGYKLATLLSVFAMAIPAILPSSLSPLFGNGTGTIYDWLFNHVDSPMMSTMFAMLAFYIASAAFRAFRARTAEATLLLITATLVMLWRVPMGDAALRSVHDHIPDLINTYIMGGANMSVQRGIIIGAALGASAMSLRIILGIERTYMGK
jgi:hypothetical protein